MQDVVILGSTGSIGTNALEVIAGRDDLRVSGLLSTGRHADLVVSQVLSLAAAVKSKIILAVTNPSFAPQIAVALKDLKNVELITGENAGVQLLENTPPQAIVLNAVDGAAGLPLTIKAIELGMTVALANKESLVVGGEYIRSILKRPDQILPVDSEHSAIYQALQKDQPVNQLILTASGGPFRNYSQEQLRHVTPAQALNHPTWKMGKLVTVNSATLMNKAFEMIEAYYLFDIPMEKIHPVIHPQSIVHSAVEYADGSVIAQLSSPDMKLPISLALNGYQHSPKLVVQPLNWQMNLSFEEVDEQRFPSIALARQAIATSAVHPAIMNAANEECVWAFLDGAIGFTEIFTIVNSVLDEYNGATSFENMDHASVLKCILSADGWARNAVRRHIKGIRRK
jgi:1-deoxy-D-xylulose-5-phosphate reductoisomerase